MSDFIFDRTEQDVLDAYNSGNISTNKKGCLNADDMNRICIAVNTVVIKLNNDYNAQIDGGNLDFQYLEGFYYWKNDFQTLVNNLTDAVTFFNENIATTPILFNVKSLSKPDYKDINAIEKTLYELYIALNIN